MTTYIQIGLRHHSTLEIIAFRLQAQEFCVRTAAIRGWVPVTPLPQSPPEVIGVMNLRGKVIPIIDLALKLGMKGAQPNERSAVVVTEAGGLVIGLLVDGVSDILTLPADLLQPIPSVESSQASVHAEGIIAHEGKMICFLNLDRMFGAASEERELQHKLEGITLRKRRTDALHRPRYLQQALNHQGARLAGSSAPMFNIRSSTFC